MSGRLILARWFNRVFLKKPQSTVALVKVWDGSAWVAKPAKHWSGAAWLTAVVRVNNGAGW